MTETESSRRGRPRPRVVSAGLACVDLMLRGSDILQTPESIGFVDSVQWTAGGSVSNTGKVLAALGVEVDAITVLGDDPHGKMLLDQWNSEGINTHWVQTNHHVNTALSTLPIYKDGRRGAYFCPGTVAILDQYNMFPPADSGFDLRSYQWFHYGYPHLTKSLRGENLAELLRSARASGLITSFDVNGANGDPGVIEPVMPWTDVFHANIEEAAHICHRHAEFVKVSENPQELMTREWVEKSAFDLLKMGATVVCITLGKYGVVVFVTQNPAQIQHLSSLLHIEATELFSPGAIFFCPSFVVDSSSKPNTTGAGDSFFGGLIAGMVLKKEKNLSIKQILQLAHSCAYYRIIGQSKTMDELLSTIPTLPTIPPLPSFTSLML
ncbi:pfkB-type carbohydrate kinase family protein [Pelomyxa schiedti]|nr:pfkB-type carbohydrate kinase family protein [Pelomyxa schiedti]